MKDKNNNHPIIMCTLTPAQVFENEALVRDMCQAGMKAVRINTAHLISEEQLEEMASKLKSIDEDLLILIDTKGPEMRTTSLVEDKDLNLAEGMGLTMKGCEEDVPSSSEVIYVNYPDIHTELTEGDEILIDDGKIRLRVESVDGDEIKAVVVTPGILGAKKGLAIVGMDLNLPAVSKHDRTYILYATKSKNIDVVAHSFVRSASDVIKVREVMGDLTKPIIAKIENQQGIDNLASIIEVSDGILIARGDLTASIGAENIPAAQEKIAKTTTEAGLPLYLATKILPSLMHGTTISQHDIEGVKKAMQQGVDIMLLTNETAAGDNPLLSVSELNKLL